MLDIAAQDNIPNLCIQSIEQRTPFQSGFFDGVVMNEVLEHLWYDIDALTEIHRILREAGRLVVTVPYMSNVQDAPEYHVRVHSPRTIRRLLERTGFEIQDHFCRGLCCQLPKYTLMRLVVYLSMKIVETVLKKDPDTSVGIVNGKLERLERYIGSHRVIKNLQKFASSYGGIMCARKISGKKDFDTIQIEAFANKA